MRVRERGFTLLEVLIASAITMCVMLATAAAVARALHGAALAEERMALRDDALNVLADVRAMTAYDEMSDPAASRVSKLIGHTSSMTLPTASGTPETISVSVTPATEAGSAVVRATVVKGEITVSERWTLSTQAPPPGSAVEQ